jgi:hypothetical protein
MSLQSSRSSSRRLHGIGAILPVHAAVVPNRSLLVRTTFLLFAVLLIEGIARKWVFPGEQEYLYFLRDPLLLCFYVFAMMQGVLQPKGWLALWLVAAILISLMSLLVYVLKELPPDLWILGVRNYFMYIPLAFIVARTFERDDIQRFARFAAILAIPIAFVCLKQFFSPPGGWINVGAGGVPPPMFAGGLLRTTGLLASDAQHVMYIAFTLSLLAAVLVAARSLRKERLLVAGCIATFVMMTVSGSRQIWFEAVGVGLLTVASVFLMRASYSQKMRAIIVPLAGGLLVAAMFSTLFAGAYNAYQQRNTAAGTFSDATTLRIVNMVLPRSMFEASIGGEGIGIATTGAAVVLKGERMLTLAEGDWDRNFIELGLFAGWIFVALRIAFALWLVSISVRAARKGDPTALLLVSFAAFAILQSQITMHTAYAHLSWFAVGLTMAAARFALAPGGATAVGIGTMSPRRSMIGWHAPPSPSFPRAPNCTSGRSRHPGRDAV